MSRATSRLPWPWWTRRAQSNLSLPNKRKSGSADSFLSAEPDSCLDVGRHRHRRSDGSSLVVGGSGLVGGDGLLKSGSSLIHDGLGLVYGSLDLFLSGGSLGGLSSLRSDLQLGDLGIIGGNGGLNVSDLAADRGIGVLRLGAVVGKVQPAQLGIGSPPRLIAFFFFFSTVIAIITFLLKCGSCPLDIWDGFIVNSHSENCKGLWLFFTFF